jgi:predicted RNA binding protein YcfA (HicA-like mRNA interferase family)
MNYFIKDGNVTYSSKDLMKMIEDDGWVLVRVRGSHHHYRHPVKPGVTTIKHPEKDTPLGTAHNILRQAGLK